MKKFSIVFIIMCTILFSSINAQAATLNYKWNSKIVYTDSDLPKNIDIPYNISKFEAHFDLLGAEGAPFNPLYFMQPWIYMDNKFYTFNLPAYYGKGLVCYGTPGDIPNNDGKYIGFDEKGCLVQDPYYIEKGDFKNVTFIKYPWRIEPLKNVDFDSCSWNGDDVNTKEYTSLFNSMKTSSGIYLKDLLKGENYFDYVIFSQSMERRSIAVLYYIDYTNDNEGSLKAEIKKLYVMTDLK